MTSSQHVSLSQYRWLAPVPASCILQMLFGFLYASGVFVAFLDLPQYTLAIGVVGFFVAVGITVFGIIMNKFIPPDYYREAPSYTAIVGSIGLASQLLMAYALAVHNTFLLFFGAVLVGLGSGAIYVTSVDVLQAWVPESPGMVTGLGMLCGGTGSLFGIYLFRVLSHLSQGPIPAMALVGLLCGGISSFVSLFVRRPPQDWRPAHQSVHPSEPPLVDERANLLAIPAAPYVVYPSLTVQDILTDPAFYLLLIAFAATVGPGFGFVLGFQQMCADMFTTDIKSANDLYLWVTVTGILGRFLSGVGVDSLQKDTEKEMGLQGARRTNLILLVTQTLALISIPYFIRHNHVRLFTLATSLVYVTFSGGAVVAACMVRGIFMPNNASLAFSLVAVSIGCGDMFFSWVIAKCGEYSALQRMMFDEAPRSHHNDYNLFLFWALLWSLLGLIATICIKTSDRVAETERDRVLPFPHAVWSD